MKLILTGSFSHHYFCSTTTNCSPQLLQRWRIQQNRRKLEIPVTHRIPAKIMGSGLGKNTVWRGDYDIQLFDPEIRDRYRLGTLRFGDLVAICDGDARFGPTYRQHQITIGIVVHGDSTVSGHGPGVTPLLSGSADRLTPLIDPQANFAVLFNLRALPPARSYQPLANRAGFRLRLSVQPESQASRLV